MRDAARHASTALGAAGWVIDFLDAAYFARSPQLRDVEDLRLAFAILTTRWHRLGRRRLQEAFWGNGREDSSMLVQIALQTAAP